MEGKTKSKNKTKEDEYYSLPASPKRKKEHSPKAYDDEEDEEDGEDDFYDSIVPRTDGSTIIPHPNYTLQLGAIFNNGYIFRKSVEYFDKNLTSAPFHFTKKGIVVENCNSLETCVIKAFFDKDEILEYYIHQLPDKDDEDIVYVLNVNLKELFEKIKSITNKTKIYICKYNELPDKVFLGFHGGTVNNRFEIMKTEDYEINNCDMGDDKHIKPEPNVKMPINDFTDICKRALKTGSSSFKCGPNSLRIVNDSLTSTDKCLGKWGLDKPGTKKYTTKIKNSMLSSGIVKMYSLNPNGTVRIYSYRKGMIKIESKISSIGQIFTYLLDPDYVKLGSS